MFCPRRIHFFPGRILGKYLFHCYKWIQHITRICSTFLAQPITFMPCWTRDFENAAPIPTEAPVTRATLPFQRSITSSQNSYRKYAASDLHCISFCQCIARHQPTNSDARPSVLLCYISAPESCQFLREFCGFAVTRNYCRNSLLLCSTSVYSSVTVKFSSVKRVWPLLLRISLLQVLLISKRHVPKILFEMQVNLAWILIFDTEYYTILLETLMLTVFRF